MPLSVTHTPVYCLDLAETLAFYTHRLGFEIRQDAAVGPNMRWLTVAAPGSDHELLLAAIDQHIPPVDQDAMRELVAKGTLPVFLQVDDVDRAFESLRAAGSEILQEPIDQPYGIRDCAVRDPNGNHLRLSQPLADSRSVRAAPAPTGQTAAPADGGITGLGRVMIVVADQERALEFYAGVLGFAVRADFPFGDGGRWLEVSAPGAETFITLNPPNNGLTPGGQTGLSFVTRDIDALHAQLVALDADVDPEVARLGGPVPPRFGLRDPDGNVLDVAQRTARRGREQVGRRPVTGRRSSTAAVTIVESLASRTTAERCRTGSPVLRSSPALGDTLSSVIA